MVSFLAPTLEELSICKSPSFPLSLRQMFALALSISLSLTLFYLYLCPMLSWEARIPPRQSPGQRRQRSCQGRVQASGGKDPAKAESRSSRAVSWATWWAVAKDPTIGVAGLLGGLRGRRCCCVSRTWLTLVDPWLIQDDPW